MIPQFKIRPRQRPIFDFWILLAINIYIYIYVYYIGSFFFSFCLGGRPSGKPRGKGVFGKRELKINGHIYIYIYIHVKKIVSVNLTRGSLKVRGNSKGKSTGNFKIERWKVTLYMWFKKFPLKDNLNM